MLLHKKGKREDLRNWQPIALSNTDSHIFSKLIAQQLGSFADSFISKAQFGFIPGRNIWENIHLINNIVESKPSHGALVFLDQEKAYNRMDWNFLIKCLIHSKFPKSFISWLENFLKSLNFKVKINDSFSQTIFPSQGLCQGDPLSPLLYNIIFESFLLSFNSSIQGISIRGQPTIKALAFADDCVLALSDSSDTKLL